MKVLDLAYKIDFIGIKNLKDLEIDNLSCKSNIVNTNGIFFCLVGSNFDGHNFYKEAITSGARCLVVERYLDAPVMQILVKNARVAMSKMASVFYGLDKTNLKLIGITGTNGKTTTTFLIKNYLSRLNKKVGLIGTEGIYFNNLLLPSSMTTPDPIDLCKILHEMELSGIEYVVMEVSAHALALNKIEGIKYDVTAITNVTQDHLDFFKTMENYSQAKELLFLEKYTKKAIFNIDDDYCHEMYERSTNKKYSVSSYLNADLVVDSCEFSEKNTIATLKAQEFAIDIKTNLLGRYNLYNNLIAIAVLLNLGFKKEEINRVTGEHEISIPGRFNLLLTPTDYSVIIDYAHTPDGLMKVLKTARELTNNRIICVFGCGGNRDNTKRHIMGEIAQKYADYTFVTTDNPRNENPILIIKDITQNMTKHFLVEQDRTTAICKALEYAKTGDIVLILGKGAENYMEIENVKYPYSDYMVVDEFFKAKDTNLNKELA